jgi:2-keto-4-pentenoate hydratase/2-oxohepta-3-ene-1,7-dioic acid hydratase in catechol pathway
MTQVGRFAGADGEFWGVVEEGSARPLAGRFEDWAPELTLGGEPKYDSPPVRLDDLRTLAPLNPSARIFCFGLTYASHTARLESMIETGGDEPPKAPGAFLKPTSAIIDPDAEIRYPSITKELDYEVEIVVVVGRPVSDGAPAQSILGYTIGNDVSARDAKNRSGGSDFFSMKALDRTAPLGPWITLTDELGYTPDLELRLAVNGELRQQERTSSLIWTFGELIDYINTRVAVQTGDLIFTGTPAGVAWEDGRYLQPGDLVEAAIEAIGTLRNSVGEKEGQ